MDHSRQIQSHHGAKSGPGLGVDVLPSPTGDAWSSVNNSTEDGKITDLPPDVEAMTEESEEEIFDFDNMDQPARRRLMRRLRETPFKRPQSGSPYEPGSDLDVMWSEAKLAVLEKRQTDEAYVTDLEPAISRLISEAVIRQLQMSEVQALSLIKGSRLRVGNTFYYSTLKGELRIERRMSQAMITNNLWFNLRVGHNVDVIKIRANPYGEYYKSLMNNS